MNIKGLQRLMELELPVPRNTVLFKTLKEIPAGHVDIYGDEPRWFMAGFDYEKSKVKDSPYIIRQVRALNVSRRELVKVFEQLEKELEKKGIRTEDRIYLLWELYNDNNTNFSGFGFRDSYEIMIDFYNGVRPSRRDSDSGFSVRIPIIGEKPHLPDIPESIYRNHAIRISNDLMILPEGTSVDLVCLKDGYFFYQDLWQNR